MRRNLLKGTAIFLSIMLLTIGIVVGIGAIKKNKKEKTISTNPNLSQEEMTILTGLVSSITGSENLLGTLSIKSSSGDCNVVAEIKFQNTEEIALSCEVKGTYNKKTISASATYLNDVAYVNFYGTKLAIPVEEVASVVSAILDGTTGGDVTEIVNLDKLESILENVVEEKQPDGGTKVILTIPNLGEIIISIDESGLPSNINAEALKLGGQTYNISFEIRQVSENNISVKTDEYKVVRLNENGNQVLTCLMDIAKSGGSEIAGSLDVDGTKVDVSIYVNSKLEVMATAKLEGLEATIYYKQNKFYLDFLGNYMSVNATDVIKLFGDLFGADMSLPKFAVVSDNSFSINKNTITFKTDSTNKIISINVSGENFAGALAIRKSNKSFTVKTTATNLSYDYVKSAIVSGKKLIEASEYSANVNASLNGKQIEGQLYLQKDANFTATAVCFIGLVNGNAFNIYSIDGYVYLDTLGNKMKFSHSSLDTAYAFISDKFGFDYLTLKDFVDYLKASKITIEAGNIPSLSISCTLGDGNISLYNTYAKVEVNNVKIASTRVSGEVSIYPNETLYKNNFRNLNKALYTDLSKAEVALESAINSLTKSQANYSGYLSLALSSTNWILKKVDVDITTYYNKTSNQLSFKILLKGLPTSNLFTNYSPFAHNNHKAEITISGNNLTVKRTIKNFWSGVTTVETNKTFNLSSLQFNTLLDALGLTKVSSKFTPGTSISLSDDALFKSISATDSKLALNLKTGLKGFNIKKVSARMTYKNGYINNLNVAVNIGSNANSPLFTVALNIYSK